MNNTPKFVVSTTLDTAEWQNSTLIKGNVSEEFTRLKQQPVALTLVDTQTFRAGVLSLTYQLAGE